MDPFKYNGVNAINLHGYYAVLVFQPCFKRTKLYLVRSIAHGVFFLAGCSTTKTSHSIYTYVYIIYIYVYHFYRAIIIVPSKILC